MVRFLCGITSPLLTAAKLTRHRHFGCAADAPFAEVKGAVEDHLKS
jgi:hypothetical protein